MRISDWSSDVCSSDLDWHPSKTALEYLWRCGHLAVAARDGFQKVYDLTERALPAHHCEVEVSEAETVDWACRAALERSEERRVGKECVSTCRSRGSPNTYNTK